MEEKARCCQNCKAPCAGDFKKVVDLQYSGLVIYLHTKKDEQKKAGSSRDDDSFILHNTSTKHLNRPEYISELHQFKTKCGQCQTIVQRVRSLLDEIRAIKENEVIGVCEHCQRVNLNKTCKRCDFIVNKFIALHQKQCEEKQQRFKIWLCRVKHLLQVILDSETICQHRVYKDTELERFLKDLKEPLSMREPDIDFFPKFDPDQLTSLQSLSESKDMLEELLAKINFHGVKHYNSEDSLYPSPSKEKCLCKSLKEGRFDGGETSGLGTGKSTDFSKLLSQDIFKKLIKRLLELSKALPQELNLNKELLQQLIGTLNTAINQGLSTDIIVKLIKELSEVRNTLPHDLSVDLNGEVIHELIKDLNDLLSQGSSPDLNKDCLQLLVDITELLTHELSKGLTKEQSEILSKSIHKDVVQALSKSGHKDKALKLFKSVPEYMEEGLAKSLHKKVKQELPISQSKEITQGSLKSQSKYSSKSLSGSRKEVPLGLTKDIHKGVEQGSSKRINIEKKHGSPRTLSKETTRGKSKDLDKEVGQGKHKEVIQDKSKGLDKEVEQVAHKKVTQDKSKGLDKKDDQRAHKKVTQDKSKGLDKKDDQSAHKKVTQDKSKGLDKEVGQSARKEVTQDKSKGLDKEASPRSNEEVTQGLTKSKGHSKYMAQGLPKNIIKGKTPASPKDFNKANKEIKQGSSTTRSKERTQTLSKNANNQLGQKLTDSKNTELIPSSLKDTSKAMSQRLSKDQNKKVIQGPVKDDLKTISQSTKGVKQDLSKDLIKMISKKVSKGLSSRLSSKTLRPGSKASKKQTSDLAQHGSQFEEDASRGKKGIRPKHGNVKDKQASESEEDIVKRGTKPRKGVSKNKYSNSETSKEKMKLSTKEKENLSPEDKKKTYKTNKSQRTVKRKSLSMEKIKILPKMSADAILLKRSQANKEKPDKYKLHQEQPLAKDREMEKKLQELTLKYLPVENNIVIQQELEDVISQSIAVCDAGQTRVPKVMVRGNMIVPYDPHYKDDMDMPVEPLIFKTQINFPERPLFEHTPTMENIFPKSKKPKVDRRDVRDGIIRYRLSDKEFIDKGWTKLPTKKIMRRMNIYRMEPASPQYDWFERHKQEKELFYDSGHKLADIDDNGRGHWYYRNGAIALDYYNAEESNTGQRYVVYSSGEEMEYGRLKPRTVLALFDVLGNGVVYDHYGNVRLKYNQSEGLIVDSKLGPPGRWKWHTLNDPPVLQQVFVNTRLKQRDHDLELVSKADPAQDANINQRGTHPEMLAIELDNFVKEKATKLLQKFKPFQIRMKAVKLNEQFALKILDQANIYLLFRDGVTSLKLNLGMLLISDEIIDTETSDLADVPTPYDRLPPKSDSVENIQKILKTVRSGKVRPSSEASDKAST